MTTYATTEELRAAVEPIICFRAVRAESKSVTIAEHIAIRLAARYMIEWIAELAAEEASKARPVVERRAEVPLYVAIDSFGVSVTDRAEDFVRAREEIAYRRGVDGRVVRLGTIRFGELCG